MQQFIKFFTKIFFVILFYSILGFIILPYFVQFYIPTIIKKTIHTESYVDSIHFNPFTFKVEINNLILKDQQKKNLLFFEKLQVNFDPLNLFKKELKVSNIAINNLKISININKKKISNFQYIIDILNKNNIHKDRKKESSKNTTNYLLKVDTLKFSNIHFSFEDYSKSTPFIINTKPINLYTRDIQLKKKHINKFNFQIDTQHTGKLSLKTNVMFEPLSIEGKVALDNIAVNKIFHYLKPLDTNFNIDSQPLNLSFDYKYLQKNILLDNLHLNINQFSFIQAPFTLKLDKFSHNIKKANIQMKENVTYDIKDIGTKIGTIHFHDKEKNTTLTFNHFSNKITNISDKKEKTINIMQTLHAPGNGTITAAIKAIQKPLQLDIKLNTKSISIRPYERYIKDFVNLDIKSATLSNTGEIQFSNENNQTKMNLKSDLAMKDIDIANSTNKQQLVKIDNLHLSNLDYHNDKLSIEKITLNKPFIAFFINENNTTNFSNIIVSTPNQKDLKKSEKQKKEFVYKVDTIVIKNGHSLFEDNTISPKFISKDTKIKGEIKNLSSDKNQLTTISHSSIIDNYAPLFINTNILMANPLEDVKSTIKVKNINLPSLSSYSGKFIGHTITNGKLALTLNSNIKKSHLTSTNNIRIKDIKLGKKVESKDAINAPIELAIALLEDSDGYIDLDIPIVGDINNPNFHLSDAILDVITNTIVGIVSAPFKFLALLVGFDGDNISNIEFGYGSYTIDAIQQEKLDSILKVLKKRPNLKLTIKTSYIKKEDSLALQEIKFKKRYHSILTTQENFKKIYEKTKIIFINIFGETKYKSLKEKKRKNYTTMLKNLKENITITTKDLQSLAIKRAQAIQSYLISKQLNRSKILIDKSIKASTKDLKINKVPVLFELQTK